MPGEVKPFEVYKYELRHKKQPFDCTKYYELLHEWLLENDFFGKGPEKEDDSYLETYYWEDRSSVREIWFWWRSKKTTESKQIWYELDIDVHIIAMSKQEVVIDGRKLKLDNGEVITEFKSKLGVDLSGLHKNFFSRVFYRLFTGRWMKDRVEFHKKELKKKTLDIIETAKKYFDLYRSDKEPLFHPTKGIEP
ncbi:MAG TPA: hypothetical protein ENN46_00515 [Candidatus Woesearchaeota archaeon]|nr:hypothetical protein [Candidatus Woesearchaeota archaeon]